MEETLPSQFLAWRLHGPGLDSLGVNRQPETIATPEPGPDEILARVDAVSLCFSDVKLIQLGGDHPRVAGRDLAAAPVIPGHEASLTIVSVGANRQDSFRVGQRCVVQADVIYQGENLVWGYSLPGALAQYTLIGRQILDGDEGCYLLPVPDDLGHSEAALAEPHACVEAACSIRPRLRPKEGGDCWLIGGDDPEVSRSLAEQLLALDPPPGLILFSRLPHSSPDLLRRAADRGLRAAAVDPVESEELRRWVTQSRGIGGVDDIIICAPASDSVRQMAPLLRPGGVIAVVREKLGALIPVDLGRVHYDDLSYVASQQADLSVLYQRPQATTDITPGGTIWFIGAGGPMGHMHLRRTLALDNPPSAVICSDLDPSRLAHLRAAFQLLASRRRVDFLALNPAEMGEDGFYHALDAEIGSQACDQVVLLAPDPQLAAEALPRLRDGGILNIFAGLARGTTISVPFSDLARRQLWIAGSSGSGLGHLRTILAMTQAGSLHPDASVAAIGGMNAAWEALTAVEEGRYPGKVVIYPQLPDLPLTAIAELPKTASDIAAHLTDGRAWNRKAEAALLRL
jgi:threonine dehydrogenase-like Zn-dependent dehydrogenase